MILLLKLLLGFIAITIAVVFGIFLLLFPGYIIYKIGWRNQLDLDDIFVLGFTFWGGILSCGIMFYVGDYLYKFF